MQHLENFPKWVKEISRFCKVKSGFVLTGNIYDSYLYDDYLIESLEEYLKEILTEKEKYKKIVLYEPFVGFKGLNFKYKEKAESLEFAYDILKKLFEESEEKTEPISIIINYASRIKDIQRDQEIFFYKIFRLLKNASPLLFEDQITRYNLLFFIAEKENDLPAWFTIDNYFVKSLSIPKPFETDRKKVAEVILDLFFNDFKELEENKKQEILKTFVSQTSGLHTKDISAIAQLGKEERLSSIEILEAIRRYKIGVSENLWATIDKEKIKNAKELLKKRIKGQEKAIIAAARSMKRAFFNLSGAQFSKYTNRPKGVLFLAGPTGTGKTELAKTITEMLFGSEDAYIRFDMSEFSQAHTEARLIGSPPGYVGYDTGGELVNKIQQSPFSVVLFDEIEKAHPKIMDIFLQILDDGRLTSGKGENVYFSEAFIIFTSNLGIYREENGKKVANVTLDDDYETIERKVLEAIYDYFTYNLQRPEILNRIGENIIVFDFIRENSAKEIFEKMFNNILAKIEDEHKIKLNITDKTIEKIKLKSIKKLEMGGRGIGNQIEKYFINPLADLLFELNPKEKDIVNIIDIKKENGKWILIGSL
jgi:ATP-dependent Clp protease ATP-binding subunit ClpA